MDTKVSVKYLAARKPVVVALKALASANKLTLFDFTDKILVLGLQTTGEEYAQPFIRETVGDAPERLRYVVPKKEKTYLKVSVGLHARVDLFAKEHRIRLVCDAGAHRAWASYVL